MKASLFIGIFLVSGIILLCSQENYAQGSRGYTDTIATPETGEDVKANEYYFEAIKARMHDDDALALTNFEKFASLKPNVPAVYNELTTLYINQKKINKAEETIKKAVDLDKNNKWYQEAYANILAIEGKYAEAGAIMQNLANTYPNDKTFLKTAVDYLEQGNKFTEALKLINKALENDDDDELMVQKVQLLIGLNEPEKAEDVLKKLIVKDNQNGRYYKILGELYDKNGQTEQAKEVYDQAMKVIPNDPTVLMSVANHYLKTGDTQVYKRYLKETIVNNELDVETQMELLDAYIQTMTTDSEILHNGLSLIAEIVRQHPADPEAQATYGDFLFRSNQKQNALVAYKKSLAMAPSNFTLWIRFLGAISDKEDADSLIRYSEKAIRYFPNQSLAHYYNAIGHYNKKEFTTAIHALNRAIDLQPETSKDKLAGMYGFIGEIYNIIKDYPNSDKSFEKAIQYEPDDAGILNNYSYFLSVRNEKLELAESLSEKSLKLRPDEPTFMDTYGWIAYKKGDYKKAKKYVENAIKLAGKNTDATLYNHLGNICFKLDEKEKALEYWKISKAMGSDDPQIDKKISEEKLYE